MKTRLPLFIFLLAVSFSFTGCAYMLNAVIFPNLCTRCMVIDHFGEIIYDFQECGGSNSDLEESAKVAAYDLSRESDLCQYTVTCESWTQEVVEE